MSIDDVVIATDIEFRQGASKIAKETDPGIALIASPKKEGVVKPGILLEYDEQIETVNGKKILYWISEIRPDKDQFINTEGTSLMREKDKYHLVAMWTGGKKSAKKQAPLPKKVYTPPKKRLASETVIMHIKDLPKTEIKPPRGLGEDLIEEAKKGPEGVYFAVYDTVIKRKENQIPSECNAEKINFNFKGTLDSYILMYDAKTENLKKKLKSFKKAVGIEYGMVLKCAVAKKGEEINYISVRKLTNGN